MEKTINLEEILEKEINKIYMDFIPSTEFCNRDKIISKNAMKEVAKQALELAAENLRQTSGQFNSDYTDEKRRILNTINKVI